MKPAPFDYVRAETVEEVLAVLALEGSDAQIIAGGQSLMPMLNTRLAKPKVLIDIMRLKQLDRIDAVSGAVTVGAGVRQRTLLGWPPLAEKLRLFAVRSPMRIPARKCRLRCWRWEARCTCEPPGSAENSRPVISSPA